MFFLVETVLLCVAMAVGTTSTDLLISGPQSTTATFGGSAAFYCVGHREIVGIQWYLNDTISSSFIDNGVMVKTVLSGKDNYTSELIVDTSFEYNSTMIKCAAVTLLPNGSKISDESETVMLIIQGQLAAPQSVYATALVCNLATVYWVNPFSYPGIPILAVIISLIDSQPEAVSVNKTTSIKPSGEEDSYDIALPVCQDPCLPVTASVVAVNGAGLGEAGFGTIFFPQAPIFSEPHHVIHYTSSDKLELQVYVEVKQENGEECVGRTPMAGEIQVTCYTQPGDSQLSFANKYLFTPVRLGDTYTHTATNIPEHMFCSYTVSLSSTENYENVSSSIMFSTHPVQDVDYQLGAREVIVICTFLQESLASGCLVVVQCAENFKMEVKISRGVSMVAVSDIITDIPSGHCDMLAYDIDEDGVLGNVPAANNSFEVGILDVGSPMPSSTGVQSPSNLSSEKVTTPLIIGIVSAVVILLILLIVVLCICILYMYYHKKKTAKDLYNASKSGSQPVLVTETELLSLGKPVGQVNELDKQKSTSTPTSPAVVIQQENLPTTPSLMEDPSHVIFEVASSEDENESEERGLALKKPLPQRLHALSGVRERAMSFTKGSTRVKFPPFPKARSASLGDFLSEEEELLLPRKETKDDENAFSLIPYKLVEREIGHTLYGKWRKLASALGFSEKEIYHITLAHGMNDLNCMCKGVIKAWLNDKPQWETMVNALKKIGETERAEQLQLKYVQGISQHVPSHKLLDEVAFAVKDQWKLVAAFLDVPKFQVGMWQEEHNSDPIECISCVFEWWEKSQSRYKLATLLDILENPAINNQDLATLIRHRCAKGRPSVVSMEGAIPQSPVKGQSSPLIKSKKYEHEDREDLIPLVSTDSEAPQSKN